MPGNSGYAGPYSNGERRRSVGLLPEGGGLVDRLVEWGVWKRYVAPHWAGSTLV